MSTTSVLTQYNSMIDAIVKKWATVLDHPDLPKIKDPVRRRTTAMVLENTEASILQANEITTRGATMVTETPLNNMGSGSVSTFDPILISLVRRTMPNLIAYDICGVQPMSGPTGLIFALRARYAQNSTTSNASAGAETFYNEVNTAYSTVVTGNTAAFGQAHSGTVPGRGLNSGNVQNYNVAFAMQTGVGEGLGTASNAPIPRMGFSIEKVTATARTRALQADYTLELAQDLKAIHGLDAEAELANILTGEILAEINREIIRTINISAVAGAQNDVTTPGVFDLDADSGGRWMLERFKGLLFQIERDANEVAKATRRGKGNVLICSSDVASALQMAGILDYAPALAGNAALQVDDTGNTFAGVLNGRIRVYIDPYATGGNYYVVGYKGSNPFDAGLFYCPYVPLQMVRAIDPSSYQPRIGFKTRYAIVANPFAGGSTPSNGTVSPNSNVYYRRVIVENLVTGV